MSALLLHSSRMHPLRFCTFIFSSLCGQILSQTDKKWGISVLLNARLFFYLKKIWAVLTQPHCFNTTTFLLEALLFSLTAFHIWTKMSSHPSEHFYSLWFNPFYLSHFVIKYVFCLWARYVSSLFQHLPHNDAATIFTLCFAQGFFFFFSSNF